MSRSTAEDAQRTRAFARVIGPFVAVATVIVAIRLPDLTGLVDDLFANAVLPWMLGAMMLIAGLIVIAFHQYWRSEDHEGNVLWRNESDLAGQEASAEAITTAVLLKAIESSLVERRRAGRGRKFRL